MYNQREGKNEIKMVVFRLGEELFGAPIHQVHEILRVVEITRVPRAPRFIEGVINLRGRIIPVLDLRRRFDLPMDATKKQQRIMEVEVDGQILGMVVDEVTEVLDIHGELIEDTPAFGAHVNTDFILGIGKGESRVTILLDIARMLNLSEITAGVPAFAPVPGDGGNGF